MSICIYTVSVCYTALVCFILGTHSHKRQGCQEYSSSAATASRSTEPTQQVGARHATTTTQARKRSIRSSIADKCQRLKSTRASHSTCSARNLELETRWKPRPKQFQLRCLIKHGNHRSNAALPSVPNASCGQNVLWDVHGSKPAVLTVWWLHSIRLHKAIMQLVQTLHGHHAICSQRN